MIQFTLGSILIALTLFFGGKDILSNHDKVTNLKRSLQSEEQKLSRARSVKERFGTVQEKLVVQSADVKNNIINQLNIDENKYSFNFTEDSNKNKILLTNSYDIVGYDSFANIFNLVSDIEKLKTLSIESVCFNCDIETEKLRISLDDVSFKIKGKAYVYNPEK